MVCIRARAFSRALIPGALNVPASCGGPNWWRLPSLGRDFLRRGSVNLSGRLPPGLLRSGWQRLFEFSRLLRDARRSGLRRDGLPVIALGFVRGLLGDLGLPGLGFFSFRLLGIVSLSLGRGMGGHFHLPQLDFLLRLQDVQTPVLERGPVLPGPL